MAASVSKSGHYGELAMGGWGNQGKREPGESGGATPWTLFINKKSKNPYERSSVKQMYVDSLLCEGTFC